MRVGFVLVAAYACLVAASEADERAEQIFKEHMEYKKKHLEGEQTEELPPYLIRDWEGYLDEFEVEDKPQTDCAWK